MTTGRRGGRKSAPADFVLCDTTQNAFGCGLLQLGKVDRRAEAPMTPSGAYRANRSHLREIATEALEVISGRDCAALDIGCNDGTLLSFYPRWVDRYGVDADVIVESVGQWAWTARAAFPSPELDKAFGDKKFDIITCASVLETVDDPRAFLARIKALLSDDGVVVIETLYAPIAIAKASGEVLGAGARAVYSLGVLERLLRDCDLKIFRGALTDKSGGSIRLFLTHDHVDDYDFDPWYERLARLWDEENALSLRTTTSYQAFENRARAGRELFQAILTRCREDGDTVHLLSDGPEALATYRWAGDAGAVFAAAVSEKPPETGAYLCDHGPVLISQTDCRAAEPDILVAPTALKREMLERWREAIMRGAQMLIPGPDPIMIGAHNFSAEFGKLLSDGDAGGDVETLRTILTAAGGPRLVAVNEAREETG